MKIKKSTPEVSGFKPFTVVVTVESREEQKMLEDFFAKNISVPNAVFGPDRNNPMWTASQDFMSTFSRALRQE